MGEMKHLDMNLDPDSEADRQRLGEIRREELTRAAQILNVSQVHTLGYRDSGMDGWDGNGHPEAFKNADEEEVVGKIVGYIRRYRPDVVVTYNEQGGYGHPDHVMTNKVTTEAIEAAADPDRFPESGREAWRVPKLYHTAWARSNMLRALALDEAIRTKNTARLIRTSGRTNTGRRMSLITTRVNISRYLRRKWRALTSHKEPNQREFLLVVRPHDGAMALLRGVLRLRPLADGGERR